MLQIWIGAKKAGLRVYVDMWAGVEADFGGLVPDISFPYRQERSWEQQLDDLEESYSDDPGKRFVLS